MELALYVAKADDLRNLDELLRSAAPGDLDPTLLFLMFNEQSATEYLVHGHFLRRLQAFQNQGVAISRLYFGQEFCEYLIPSLAELEEAYAMAQQREWQFTYVTGYVTDAGLAKTRRNLEFLAEQDAPCEVVVNDWGVLAVIARELPQLQPVLGRMMIKQQRMARFSRVAFPPVNLEQIDALEEEIQANQLRVLRGLHFVVRRYREELQRLRVRRLDLDIVPQGVDLPPDAWGFGVSCYFPWSYVTCGRNCLTASVNDPWREYVVVEGTCARPCRTLNRSTQLEKFGSRIAQRGNAVFVANTRYADHYLTGELPVDRVVLEPYIPI